MHSQHSRSFGLHLQGIIYLSNQIDLQRLQQICGMRIKTRDLPVRHTHTQTRSEKHLFLLLLVKLCFVLPRAVCLLCFRICLFLRQNRPEKSFALTFCPCCMLIGLIVHTLLHTHSHTQTPKTETTQIICIHTPRLQPYAYIVSSGEKAALDYRHTNFHSIE